MNTSDTGQEQRPIYMLDQADLEAVTDGAGSDRAACRWQVRSGPVAAEVSRAPAFAGAAVGTIRASSKARRSQDPAPAHQD